MRNYYCPKCHRTVARDSKKRRLKSYCDRTDQYVKLRRVDRVKSNSKIQSAWNWIKRIAAAIKAR